MTTPPLIRFALIRLSPQRHILAITNHHILLDGWSMSLLLRDLLTCYTDGDDRNLPPVTPYQHYLSWLAAQDPQAARDAWAQALAGLEHPTLIAPGAPASTGTAPATITTDLSPQATAALTATARTRHLTLNTVIQTTWALLLHSLTGAADITFGATVSGRPPDLPGVEHIIGLLINTIPVRITINPAETVLDLMTRTQHQQTSLIPHHHLPLTDIHRQTPHTTLFDTSTVYQNFPDGSAGTDAEVAGMGIEPAGGFDTYHYPVKLMAVPGDRLHLALSYRTDLFSEQLARLILGDLERLLTSVSRDATMPVGEVLPVMTATRHEQRLRDLFAEAAGADRVARGDDFFTLGGDSLRALRLAGRVSAEFGVDLDVRDVFRHPTAASLARVLESRFRAVPSGANTQEGKSS